METNTIPKIIHQIWLDTKIEPPINLINSWKEDHPDYKYILWTEENISSQLKMFKCQNILYEIKNNDAKKNILKWEILYNYGGIYVDIDNICIQKLDDILLENNFCSYELSNNTSILSECVIGFKYQDTFLEVLIEYILDIINDNQKINKLTNLLTILYNNNKYTSLFNNINILPNYSFIPSHYNGYEYNLFEKVYSYKIWSNIRVPSYGLNNCILPLKYTYIPPEKSVSLLIPIYNTPTLFIKECLESIKHQNYLCNIEIVLVDDGSTRENSEILLDIISEFLISTRFIKVLYHKNPVNMGIGYALNLGVTLCSNEIILRMDSDDIMMPNRIEKQLNYMLDNSNVMMCASQVAMFKENINNITEYTYHKTMTWEQYKQYPLQWFVNHPTYCFRKSAALEIGNYGINDRKMMDDFSFSIRMLKRYGYIYNFSEPLLYYRVHNTQLSNVNSNEAHYYQEERIKLIRQMIYN
jgi:GT2 family glycosyltransferase